jgi:hypothetical protein
MIFILIFLRFVPGATDPSPSAWEKVYATKEVALQPFTMQSSSGKPGKNRHKVLHRRRRPTPIQPKVMHTQATVVHELAPPVGNTVIKPGRIRARLSAIQGQKRPQTKTGIRVLGGTVRAPALAEMRSGASREDPCAHHIQERSSNASFPTFPFPRNEDTCPVQQ